MSNDPRIEIGIRLDLNQYNRDKQSLISDLRTLEGRSFTIGVDLDIGNLAAAESLIAGLGSTQNLNVDVNLTGDDLANVERIAQDQTVNIDANVDDSEVDTLFSRLSESITLTVDLPDLASAGLGFAGGAIGTALDFSGISGLFETNQALLELEATTGRIIPNAERLINDIYTDGWGESRAQIAETIATATQLGIANERIQEAAVSALQVSLVTGQDVNEVLRTQTTLVNTELVGSYTEAGDVLVGAFQNGIDRAGDFTETLNEYGAPLQELGFEVSDLFAIFDTGFANGIRDTDVLADGLLEFSIRLGEVGGTADEALERLDLTDLRQAWLNGEVDFDTFYNAVLDGLNEIEDPLERNTATIELFGTKAEDLGTGTFLQTLTDARDGFVEIEGSASDAANTLSTSIPNAINRLGRVISTGIGEQLDDALDISGRIQAAQDGAEAFFAALDEGASVGEAIGIGLEVAGLDDLQEALSDFLFGFLSGIRDAIDIIPGADTSGIDRAIATLGGAQFEVELASASNFMEFEEAIRTALDRGVSSSDVEGLLEGRFDTAIDSSDFTEIGQLINAATATGIDTSEITTGLQETYTTAVNDLIASGELADAFDLSSSLMGAVTGANVDSSAIRESISNAYVDALSDGEIFGGELEAVLQRFEITDGLLPPPDEVATQLDNYFDTFVELGDLDIASRIANVTGDEEQLGIIEGLISPEDVETVTQATSDVATATEDMSTTVTENVEGAGESVSTFATDTEAINSALATDYDGLGESITTFTDNAVANFNRLGEAWALTNDGISMSIALLTTQLSELATNVDLVLLSAGALQGVSIGGGGGGTVNNINQSNTFINNSAAAGAATGAATAQALTGG